MSRGKGPYCNVSGLELFAYQLQLGRKSFNGGPVQVVAMLRTASAQLRHRGKKVT